MKTFIDNKFIFEKLPTEEINNKRYYITPSGLKYPSVTTVLSEHKDKTFLKEWEKRIGVEEAERIIKYSADIGTNVHEKIEKYLKNELVEKDETHSYMMFCCMKYFLKKINNIHALEISLFSDILKMAGRVDCIAEYDNELSIIDFKTSKKEKKEEWIENYFIQGSIYSIMYEELTGIRIPLITILLITQDYKTSIWQKKRKEYFPKIKYLADNVVPKLLIL